MRMSRAVGDIAVCEKRPETCPEMRAGTRTKAWLKECVSKCEAVKFIGRGARGCAYSARLETGERVLIQVVLAEMLLLGTVGTPTFLQLDAPGFAESYGDETVVVLRVPQGEWIRPGMVKNARKMLSVLVKIFRSMEERNLAMVEFDASSVIVAGGEVCLVDIGCTVCNKDRPFEYLDVVSGCPPDDVFTYDNNTVWRLGKVVAAFDSDMSPHLFDLLRRVFAQQTKRITLQQLFDHPYFFEQDDAERTE